MLWRYAVALLAAVFIGFANHSVCSQGIYICQGANCPPSLNGITLSGPGTFNSGAASSTVIGNLSVLTSGPAFSGSYAAPGGPDGAKFQVINGNQLATNGVVAAAGSTQTYNITITATQASAVNGSVTVPLTVTAQQVPIALSYNPPSPISVLDNITTATTLSAVSVSPSDGQSFLGTLSLTANAGGRVTLSGTNLVPAHNFTSADDGLNLVVTTQASENGTTISATLLLNVNSSNTAGVNFTALHVYYMSPTGNDSNNGTSPSTPWLTPNHSVACGDVILAQSGSYVGTGLPAWGAVSGCPSTSGGIDGAGGIYFATLLCAGNVGSCNFTYTGGGGTYAVDIKNNNWSMQGWKISTSNTNALAFTADACASGTTILHHHAFVNDMAVTAGIGFTADECGLNQNVPGNGTDYFAVVGNIAQNAAERNDFPAGAIDATAPANSDTVAGVHIYIGGNFGISNQTTGTASSDGECLNHDSWDAHGFVGTGVYIYNICVNSSWAGMQVTMHPGNSSAPIINILNNTIYDSGSCPTFTSGAGALGEFNTGFGASWPWVINVFNNVLRTSRQFAVNSGTGIAGQTCNTGAAAYMYAISVGGSGAGTTVVNEGGSGVQNVVYGTAGLCEFGPVCDSTNSVRMANGYTLGTDFYQDPQFANASDLTTNHLGAPNCSGFPNTTACMGWNYSTQTATANTVIADLVAGCGANCVGKGYQPPSSTCGTETTFTGSISGTTLTVSGVSGKIYVGQQVYAAAGAATAVAAKTIITAGSGTSWTVNNSQTVASEAMGATGYPYWLKGIVYLQANGFVANPVISENYGLINKPCGM